MKAKRHGIIDDAESEQHIVRIYNKAVAQSLSHNLEKKIRPFIEQKKSLAQRIASEYVANFLAKHKMDVSFAMAQKETNEYIHEEHNPAWTARRLGLHETEQLFHSIVDGCGITVYHTTTLNEPEPKQKKYTVPDKDNFTTGDFLNSNENEFTGFLVTTDPEPPKKKEHKHHHRSRDIREESNTFTALNTVEEKYDRLGNPKNKLPKPNIDAEPSSRHSRSHTHTHSRTHTHTRQTDSHDSFFDEPQKPEDPKRKQVDELFIKAREENRARGAPTKSFAERLSALMISSKLRDREVNADKCDGYATLCSKDLSPESMTGTIDNPSLTAERLEGTSNALSKYMKSMKSGQSKPLPPDSDSRLPTGEPTADIFDTSTRDGEQGGSNKTGAISVPRPTQSRIMSSKAGSDAIAAFEKMMNSGQGRVPIAAPEDVDLSSSIQSIQEQSNETGSIQTNSEDSYEEDEEEEVVLEEEEVSESETVSKKQESKPAPPPADEKESSSTHLYEEVYEEEEVVEYD